MGNLDIGWLVRVPWPLPSWSSQRWSTHAFDATSVPRRSVYRGGSQVIETDCGPIEYATFGEGLLCSWCTASLAGSTRAW